MKLHTFLRVVAFAVAAAGVVKSASAAPIVYSDRTAFHAAAGATSVLTFDDLANGPVSACLPASPYTGDPCELPYGGATFVATVGLPDFDQDPLLFASPVGAFPTNALSCACIPLDADDFYFTFESNAVGFSLPGFSTPPVYIEIEDANGQTTSYQTVADPFVAPFFGVVSDVALKRVSVYTGDFEFGRANFGIDDVELQGGTVVPEPSTLALMFGGLAAVARRRQRSNS